MDLAFEPISLERREEYTRALETSPHVTSDYAFANIWGWAVWYIKI